MKAQKVIIPRDIAIAREQAILATAAHMAIREVIPREHPERIATKAALVEAHELWRAVVKSN